METIEKIKTHKLWYRNTEIQCPVISTREIRDAVSGSVETLEGVEVLIRIQKSHGRHHGGTSKSAAFGAKYEYYGLKDSKVVITPSFAPVGGNFKKRQTQ